jgi:histone-lysine N-methyltransferase SETD7
MSQNSVQKVSSTIYHRDESTHDCISQDPMLPDPYESKMVYVGKSSIAGEGLFALHDLQPDIVVSFYNGIRLTHKEVDERDWQLNSNTISLDSEVNRPPTYFCLSV